MVRRTIAAVAVGLSLWQTPAHANGASFYGAWTMNYVMQHYPCRCITGDVNQLAPMGVFPGLHYPPGYINKMPQSFKQMLMAPTDTGPNWTVVYTIAPVNQPPGLAEWTWCNSVFPAPWPFNVVSPNANVYAPKVDPSGPYELPSLTHWDAVEVAMAWTFQSGCQASINHS